jgi:hypothetical protein
MSLLFLTASQVLEITKHLLQGALCLEYLATGSTVRDSSPDDKSYFLFFTLVQTGNWTQLAFTKTNTEVFSRDYRGRGMGLTTHPI